MSNPNLGQPVKLDRVEVTRDEDGSLTVFPYYAGVDRPQGCGMGLRDDPAGRKLAARLVAAIEAGVAYPNPVLAVDVAGKTYAKTGLAVVGRRLNADLKRVGF